MNYSVSSFKVYIDKVNPDSWIIRALENNGYDLDYCLELDYLAGFIAIEIYIGMNSIGYANSWIIPRTRITPGNSCSGFITMLGQSIRTWKVIRNIFRVWVGVGPPICFHFSFLLGLPTQAFFIYELIRPLRIQPGYHLVPYSGHKP